MIKLSPPCDNRGVPYSAGEVYDLCVSGVKEAALKERLEAIRPDVEDIANRYDQAAKDSILHQIERSDGCRDVTKSELTGVYATMRDQDGNPGRAVYDQIRSASPNRLCPLCGMGTVKTLDHHLPKTRYPLLSVSPTNLVPACQDCQVAKGTKYPKTEDKQTLHPYFDEAQSGIWLRAKVAESDPPAFRYFVDPLAPFTSATIKRLKRHMEVFDLAERFATRAGQSLPDMQLSLTELLQAKGADEVRKDLQSRLRSAEAACGNSWSSAMFRAAIESDWFCSGGFGAK